MVQIMIETQLLVVGCCFQCGSTTHFFVLILSLWNCSWYPVCTNSNVISLLLIGIWRYTEAGVSANMERSTVLHELDYQDSKDLFITLCQQWQHHTVCPINQTAPWTRLQQLNHQGFLSGRIWQPAFTAQCTALLHCSTLHRSVRDRK